MTWNLLFAVLFLGIWSTETAAQSVQLSERNSGSRAVNARIGETIEIAVDAQLGRFSASGVSLYIGLPHGAFEVVHSGFQDARGVVPFRPGYLFADAAIVANQVLPANPGLPHNLDIIQYVAVTGPGKNRGRTGSGILATFELRCTGAISGGKINVFSNPVFESRLVSATDNSERPFFIGENLIVDVGRVTAVEQSTWALIKSALTREDGLN
jgi:hypothetical protein